MPELSLISSNCRKTSSVFFSKYILLLLQVFLLTTISFAQDEVFKWGNLDKSWTVKEFKINSKYFYENTVAVIAPGENKNCPNGKVIVMTGQDAGRAETKRMIVSDLYKSDGKLNTAIGTDVTLGINSNIESLATDNQIIKLNDGSLVAIKLGFLWSPITPKPFWWDWTSDNTTDYKKGARDAIFVYKSTDCGVNWTNISKIDSTKIDKGQYGIPKKSKEKVEDDEDNQDEDKNANQLYHSNGFDRQEAYYDKWTEEIYISTQIASGGYEKNGIKIPGIDKYGVLVSSDKGLTWKLVKETNKRLLVMTTNPNGRFFMFSVSKGKPVLFYTKSKRDFDLSTLDSIDISCKKDYPKYPDKMPTEAQRLSIHQSNKLQNYSIANGYSISSKASTLSSIYVAYQVLNSAGKIEYMIVKAFFVDVSITKQILVNYKCQVVKASDEDHSLNYGTFVESTEQQHVKKGSPYSIDPKTLFFYVESTAGDNFKGEKKAAFKGMLINNKTNEFSPKFFLSKDNDDNRWFNTNKGIGHYTKGAYFINNQNQNYVAQWSESDGIHVSVISGVELRRKNDKAFLDSINDKFTKSNK